MKKEQPAAEQPPIGDYAVIGNCHTAALVSRAGSIDWWCPMRFDRPAVFSALLDEARGGRFQIRPAAPCEVERRYIEGTNVLETTFQTQNGRLRLTDLMPLGGEGEEEQGLNPPHALLRAIECVAGSIEVELIYEPRFGYGKRAPRFRTHGDHTLYGTHGSEALALRSELPLRVREEGAGATARVTLSRGERRFTGLTYTQGEPLVLSPLGEHAEALLEQTVHWWKAWTGRCAYDGPYGAAVRRSALALKLLTYAPSGAIVAAPTTSLPEEIGGARNWDYRYCWLRDASMTMRALLDLGYREEGGAFLSWLLHATHLTWPRLQVFYDVFGRTGIEEQGYSEAVESYVQSFDNEAADASLLLLPLQGYDGPDAPRTQSTYAFLEEKLATGTLWRRYPSGADDGLSGGEAAFGICSFWAVEHLARAGRREVATRAFERLLSYANDVGLFAEEIDPESGALLGNFPQAFTHVGLINAALALEDVPQEQAQAPRADSP